MGIRLTEKVYHSQRLFNRDTVLFEFALKLEQIASNMDGHTSVLTGFELKLNICLFNTIVF